MTSGTGSESGFTLVEVLVSALILFAGVAAILVAYARAAETLQVASETLTGALFMREQIESVREPLLDGRLPSFGVSAGVATGPAGRPLAWTCDVSRRREPAGLIEAKVSVEAQGGRRRQVAVYLVEPLKKEE